METEILFNQQANTLQGRLAIRSKDRAAIITHPHPLYGGDMDNVIVATIVAAYAQMQWTTLRFNFRGTGQSQGCFDHGIGEQEDVQAAIDQLRQQGFEQIDLAGYSFGTLILARWSRNHHPHSHALRFVAPPVAFLDFETQRDIPGLRDVFVGRHDDLAPLDQIQRALPYWQPAARLHVIDSADHFFSAQLRSLQAEITIALMG